MLTIVPIYGGIFLLIIAVCAYFFVQVLRSVNSLLSKIEEKIIPHDEQINIILENLTATSFDLKDTAHRIHHTTKTVTSLPNLATHLGKELVGLILGKKGSLLS